MATAPSDSRPGLPATLIFVGLKFFPRILR